MADLVPSSGSPGSATVRNAMTLPLLPFDDRDFRAPHATVAPLLAAGTRAARPDPERFDVDRADPHHLSFGWGMHFCMGAGVARMEARVAFEVLLSRIETIEHAGSRPVWAPATALRTLERFPLRLHPASRDRRASRPGALPAAS